MLKLGPMAAVGKDVTFASCPSAVIKICGTAEIHGGSAGCGNSRRISSEQIHRRTAGIHGGSAVIQGESAEIHGGSAEIHRGSAGIHRRTAEIHRRSAGIHTKRPKFPRMCPLLWSTITSEESSPQARGILSAFARIIANTAETKGRPLYMTHARADGLCGRSPFAAPGSLL